MKAARQTSKWLPTPQVDPDWNPQQARNHALAFDPRDLPASFYETPVPDLSRAP